MSAATVGSSRDRASDGVAEEVAEVPAGGTGYKPEPVLLSTLTVHYLDFGLGIQYNALLTQ